MARSDATEGRRYSTLGAVAVIIAILFLIDLIFAGAFSGPETIHVNPRMRQARQIGQALLSYATDNTSDRNAFPDGKSSTEVFQALLDTGYVTDPMIFYFPMTGKIAPTPGQNKLRPENVCWDITAKVDPSSSDLVPLVFLTGYKVSYIPRSAAVLVKPGLRYGFNEEQAWWQRLLGMPGTLIYEPANGIAVYYKGQNAAFIRNDMTPAGTIPNFVSPSYSDSKTYRQLTPDGVLP